MTLPIGSKLPLASWVSKGLRVAGYVSGDGNGLWVYNHTQSATAAATPSSGTTVTPANSWDITHLGKTIRRYNSGQTAGTSKGELHRRQYETFPAVGNNMTFIFDSRGEIATATATTKTTIFQLGSGSTFRIEARLHQIGESYFVFEFLVQMANTGLLDRVTFRVETSEHASVGFAYTRGTGIRVFKNGVKLAAGDLESSTVANVTSIATATQDWRIGSQPAWARTLRMSHLYAFNTALSDEDVIALTSDPGLLFTEAVVPSGPPEGTVTVSSVTPGETTASVTYNYSGTDQTGFEYRLGSGDAAPISASPAVIAGLNPSTLYDLQLRAINAEGAGSWSSITQFTTLAEHVVTPGIRISDIKEPNISNQLIASASGVRLKLWFNKADTGAEDLLVTDATITAGVLELPIATGVNLLDFVVGEAYWTQSGASRFFRIDTSVIDLSV
jgi:hypothetical protein